MACSSALPCCSPTCSLAAKKNSSILSYNGRVLFFFPSILFALIPYRAIPVFRWLHVWPLFLYPTHHTEPSLILKKEKRKIGNYRNYQEILFQFILRFHCTSLKNAHAHMGARHAYSYITFLCIQMYGVPAVWMYWPHCHKMDLFKLSVFPCYVLS